jgi:para-nitrobenzyl esterase
MERVREVKQAGVACMQPPMAAGPYNGGALLMDEDCLTLDVIAPANTRNAPVMVWIHGGTLIWGTGHAAMYNGREFAKRGIVLVSINYRLGVFGYLAHPELSRESSDNVSGNYGLLDHALATKVGAPTSDGGLRALRLNRRQDFDTPARRYVRPR